MLKLSRYENIVTRYLPKLRLGSVYELFFDGSDDDVANALAEHPELAEKVLSIRRELRRIANGDELAANVLMNYLLLRAGNRSVPKALAREIARRVPGVYIVSGERVLVAPGDEVPEDLELDENFMLLALNRLTSLEDSGLKVAGTEVGLDSYETMYLMFFDYKFAEDALLLNVLKTFKVFNIPVLGYRARREEDAIVVEVDVDVNGAVRTERRFPGRMVFEVRVDKDKNMLMTSSYRDDVVHVVRRVEDSHIGARFYELVPSMILAILNQYDTVVDAKSIAEKRGYEWIVAENTSYAVKRLNAGGTEVVMKMRYKLDYSNEVTISVEAPSTSRVQVAMQRVNTSVGARLEEVDGKLVLTMRHSMNRGLLQSLFEFSESLLSKLRSLIEVGAVHEHNRDKLLGALLLKVTAPERYQDIFERHGTSFLEALRTLFPDASGNIIAEYYRNQRELLHAVACRLEVADDGEPVLHGKPVDEYLSLFDVDHRTVIDVKRTLVRAFNSVRKASLSAMLLVRRAEITPNLIRKLAAYGDFIPVEVLEHSYGGKPIWCYLSEGEKLVIVARLAEDRESLDRLLNSQVLSQEDGRVLAKAMCLIGLPSCTEMAFSELRDELMVPRHAVLRRLQGEVYIDTGAYLVKVKSYDLASGLYAFTVKSKASNAVVEIKERTLRDAVFRAIEEEENLNVA